MSATDDISDRLSRIYIRARSPELVDVQSVELLKALLALAYTEGVCAGAEAAGGLVGASFDAAIKKLTAPSLNGVTRPHGDL